MLFGQMPTDGCDDVGGRQHSGFNHGDRNIGKERIELCGNDRDRQMKNGRDATRILCGNGRQHRHSEHPVCGHGFEIGLNAGPSTTIRAGDGANSFFHKW